VSAREVSAHYTLRNAGMSYGETSVLRGVTLDLRPPELTALVGPNGAGKSTLLGILAGLREGYIGECRLNGTEVRQWKRRPLARLVSFVPQSVQIEFPFTAEQVVLMGRAPHADGIFEGEGDRSVAREAMELTDTLRFRSRDFRSLSGGERQRVILASALAQSPAALLLDEPTTYLDLHHQVALYGILRTLCERGVLVVTVTHDLNLAAAYARRVIMLCCGEVVADAAPAEALQPGRLRAVFNVRSELLSSPDGGYWIRYGE
jgi:ABC-type cobalamin/Fe3+-siderophores transport system ATPase subunit